MYQYIGEHGTRNDQVLVYIGYNDCVYFQHSMELVNRYQVDSYICTCSDTTPTAAIQNNPGHLTDEYTNPCANQEQHNIGRDGIVFQHATSSMLTCTAEYVTVGANEHPEGNYMKKSAGHGTAEATGYCAPAEPDIDGDTDGNDGIQITIAPGHDLLDLRGGGQRRPGNGDSETPAQEETGKYGPPGAGVLLWLLDEPGHQEYEEREVSRMQQGGQTAHGPRRISLWDELGLQDGVPPPRPPAGGLSAISEEAMEVELQCTWEKEAAEWERRWSPTDAPPPRRRIHQKPMTITGMVGERAVVVCLGCFKNVDRAEGNWRQCGCGTQACVHCANSVCPGCGSMDWRTPQIEPATDGASEYAMAAIDSSTEHERGTDNGGGSGQDGPPPERMDALICSRCQLGSLRSSAGWRICRCRAATCEDCAAYPCQNCGSRFSGLRDGCHDVDADDRDGDEGRGSWEQTYDQDSQAEDSDGHSYDTAELRLDDRIGGQGYEEQAYSGDYLHMAKRLTPQQALQRREEMTRTAQEDRTRRREEARRTRAEQVKQGRRPAGRYRSRASTVSFCSVNVTSGGPWREEMEFGRVLKDMDYIAVQEHKLGPTERDYAGGRLRSAGWDPHIDEPYWKEGGYGGGTAILAKEGDGSLPVLPTKCGGLSKGRWSFCNLTIFGGIGFGNVYGLSGRSCTEQLALWREIAEEVRLAGLPCILTGDWQVPPDEMRSSGFPELIGATVVAPTGATNLNSGSTIDYFLVADPLVQFIADISVSFDTKFTPHAPVILRMKAARSAGEAWRAAQPRLLAVDRPMGAMPAGLMVDWEKWIDDVPATNDDQNATMPDLDALAQEWFAGAEAELLTLHGLAGTAEEVHHMGIGSPTRMVRGAASTRRHCVADALGILGHRLAWAARGLHLAVHWGRRLQDADLTSDKKEKAAWVLFGYGHRAVAFLHERIVKDPVEDDELETCKLKHALSLLGNLIRTRRGIPP